MKLSEPKKPKADSKKKKTPKNPKKQTNNKKIASRIWLAIAITYLAVFNRIKSKERRTGIRP